MQQAGLEDESSATKMNDAFKRDLK